jgi:hypothetical protein
MGRAWDGLKTVPYSKIPLKIALMTSLTDRASTGW